MIRFLIKGLLRDRHRSLFPVIVVTLGVMLTVLLHCWITGVLGDVTDFNARFSTGHVRVITRAYAENMDQTPNDLALTGVSQLIELLKERYPGISWHERIRFGGLIDIAGESGETRAQGPAMGWGVDLLSGDGAEIERLNIRKALMRGRMPAVVGEVLLSDEFAERLDVGPGDVVTLLGSTMYGSMAMRNFEIAGTVEFGITVMDRGAIIADVSDVQAVLDMEDAAGEIVGYFAGGVYDDEAAAVAAGEFNEAHAGGEGDEFAPLMLRLKEQNDLAGLLDYANHMKNIVVTVFVLAMSVVLWNAGLIGGLRRYGEIGIRLAIGEYKGRIYRAMLCESAVVGLIGSALGTMIGLGVAYILQTKGIDVGGVMKSATIMLPTVFRAHITEQALYVGFVPGLFATFAGTMLSGIGIYRRRTARLFKELEA